MTMDAIGLNIFASRITAVCDEMGAVLRRTALSSNIKDRLDYSCAVFDADGELCAQAAHIPVHLGSMAYAMSALVAHHDWRRDDMMIVNDPFLGGTHLPDVTLIAPVFTTRGRSPVAFVANRAHHADIGAATPGSMPVSRHIDEEGLLIPPTVVVHGGRLDDARLAAITGATRNVFLSFGDYAAQISANRSGVRRVMELVSTIGARRFRAALAQLNDYAERLACSGLEAIPDGEYLGEDVMDDDGTGRKDVRIAVAVRVRNGTVYCDFSGTAPQVDGNINCPLSVAAAAVFYVFRCLMPENTPACAGSLRPIGIHAPPGSLLNARSPAAVAAGNVETSTRIVDVVMRALSLAIPGRIPAASHGSMNNVAMGGYHGGYAWDYYETLGGGMGAGPDGGGLSAVQTHMTNTRNTPIESLEMHFPVRVRRYEIRRGSGGDGRRRGGDGVVREYELLTPATVTLLTERRGHAPWGLAGGGPGACGVNRHNAISLPSKVCFQAKVADRIVIETPGGGGWGR